MSIEEVLAYEEGYREHVYYCSEGYPTIGIGTKIGPKGAPLSMYTFVCSRAAAEALLTCEVINIRKKLETYPTYLHQTKDRKIILESMAYQMGVSGLLNFKKMWAALAASDFKKASEEALDSRWAKQTPNRAHRHAKVLLTGDLSTAYN